MRVVKLDRYFSGNALQSALAAPETPYQTANEQATKSIPVRSAALSHARRIVR